MSTGSSSSGGGAGGDAGRPPRPNLPPLTGAPSTFTGGAGSTNTPQKRRLRKDASDVFITDESEMAVPGRFPLPSPTNRTGSASAWSSQQPQQPQQNRYSIDPSKLFTVDGEINHDILVLVNNYLTRCGLNATATTLRNEAGLHAKQTRNVQRQVREAVLEGDWESLRETSKTGPAPRLRRAFLYLVNRQEFLELVNKQESQQAFSQLLRRLKPLEAQAKIAGDDFRDLAYLATCRSVTDAPAFRSWDGVPVSRRKLARELCGMIARHDLFREDSNAVGGGDDDDGDTGQGTGAGAIDDELFGDGLPGVGGGSLGEQLLTDSDVEFESIVNPDDEQSAKPVRLVSLLQQAYAYQVEKKTLSYYQDSPDGPPAAPRVTSLLVDFTAPILPDKNKFHVLAGHEQSVKCVEFLGGDRKLVASGSSDWDVCLWDFDNLASPSKTFLKGHKGRVWDVASTRDGALLASVSADSKLRIWDTTKIRLDEASSLLSTELDLEHAGDIYSVSFHPESSRHLVTAGHDQTVRLVDIEYNKVIKVFTGHAGSVVHALFNPVGNLIVTGSKDSTVKFFDVVSGVCVKTIPQLLGAVTSVQLNRSGDKLLTGTKDSSNRLWDIRTGNVLSRFKGHVNSSKNFIRAHFGASDQIVLGGSEDGAVYVWDADSGRVLDRLTGHAGSVFRATWSQQWGMLGSCSEDGTVRLWEAKGSLLTRRSSGSLRDSM